MLSLSDQASLDEALAALGTAQHAVFRLDQVCDLGVTPDGVRKRTKAGRLHRIYTSVYSLVPRELLTRDGHRMAAVLACGEGAVLSHRAAAALHELRDSSARLIDIAIPRRSSLERPGIRVHRSTTLTPGDVSTVRGIPVTTVARTAFDLAETVSRRTLERLLDEAEMLEVFDLTTLIDQIERNPTRKGAKKLRHVLDTHYAGRTPTWSELEEGMLALTRAAGLPDPEVNKWIVLDDGGPPIRGDFIWREQRIVVETDGYRAHGRRQAFERDRETSQRLLVAQWCPFRTTGRQVFRDGPRIQKRLLKLFASG